MYTRFGEFMLKIYARHVASCHQKATDFRKCRCPKWIMGALPSGEFVRESTKQTSWDAAERIAKARWDNSLPGAPKLIAQHLVTKAIERYTTEGETRQLSDGTHHDRKTILSNQLLPWCSNNGIIYMDEITPTSVASFFHYLKTTKKNGGTTMRKKYASLRAFFNFCVDQALMREHPMSRKMRMPQSDSKPTDWLQPEEYEKVMASARNFKIKGYDYQHRAERAALLIEVMRWSGLRREDAVTLKRARIDANGHLFLHTAKTGIPVMIALPPHLLPALVKLPCPNPEYFFWTGRGTVKAATSAWDRTLSKIFARSGVNKHIHCHMLRDTFAVSLLLAGVPLDQVSILLGHSTTKTTEKHYAPFVAARRDQLLLAVRRAWPESNVVPTPDPRQTPVSG